MGWGTLRSRKPYLPQTWSLPVIWRLGSRVLRTPEAESGPEHRSVSQPRAAGSWLERPPLWPVSNCLWTPRPGACVGRRLPRLASV